MSNASTTMTARKFRPATLGLWVVQVLLASLARNRAVR